MKWFQFIEYRITERRSRSIRKWGRVSAEANDEKRDGRRMSILTFIYSHWLVSLRLWQSNWAFSFFFFFVLTITRKRRRKKSQSFLFSLLYSSKLYENDFSCILFSLIDRFLVWHMISLFPPCQKKYTFNGFFYLFVSWKQRRQRQANIHTLFKVSPCRRWACAISLIFKPARSWRVISPTEFIVFSTRINCCVRIT